MAGRTWTYGRDEHGHSCYTCDGWSVTLLPGSMWGWRVDRPDGFYYHRYFAHSNTAIRFAEARMKGTEDRTC